MDGGGTRRQRRVDGRTHGHKRDVAASPAALDRIAAAYGPRRDLRALVTAIVTDPEFAGSTSSIVGSPVEWTVGATRAVAPQVDTAEGRADCVHHADPRTAHPFRPDGVGC